MAFCFISDLHLHDDRPEITKAFISFIKNTASKAERLYVLGDFFEAWIGDDNETDLTLLVKKTLLGLSTSTDIYVMHGNREDSNKSISRLLSCLLYTSPSPRDRG